MKKDKKLHLFIGLIGLLVFLPACNTNENSVVASLSTVVLPSSVPEDALSYATNSPILPSSSPVVQQQVVLPTPNSGMGTVVGTIVNKEGKPMSGLTIYLGDFDGMLVEISMQNSPRTVTDEQGKFLFANIPPTNQNMQYAVGIIIGADNGRIINESGTNHTLTFDVREGDIVDLGELESDL